MELPLADVPEPDATLEPAGFMVGSSSGDRSHFLDWGGPPNASRRPGVVAVHGLRQTSWIWAPVARRLGGPRGRLHVVTMDLRGHGLSDAPTEDGAYDLTLQADDVVAVAEGSGLLGASGDRVVLAGHGFGAIVAAHAAATLKGRCAGLVLVDGGWEALEPATGLDADTFLREVDEPPEVMRSIGAFLADRKAFDPSTWDADQERAARSEVVETHAGRVVPSARPHATEASTRAMFTHDPRVTLAAVFPAVAAVLASDDETGSREQALAAASSGRLAAGRPAIELV
ncbi:MAG: alpha/beta fold hydrolase, partial [Chloroflexi bacterium]|nr:alpha/beta fold hydrolase [Chloroflexota bacterium]